ncbi:hypothetical protein AMTRI_Chr03g51370 [Amborella trichopoda]|uniref:Uncharacterized protein n=1 Tax=Amborella trichopoda TaxID=13333 RepID=U5CQW0_AMBTC|nr:uncharacterized protein LOC18443866 [Amborella trichopoda]ERN15576.1 hypothetical protein AMTR_s00048p00146940 [Amborella trichopoda]|eukprot:XP_006854109.1 uncharacterized protein LOC18443866 [Amborella trichopoda]
MAKINAPLRNNMGDRRSRISDRKRKMKGDPITGKLKQTNAPTSISGKRKRKLFKKWRKGQKEALQKGLVTMEGIEMAVTNTEGASHKADKVPTKFQLKKSAKLRLKKHKGKGKGIVQTSAPFVDAMAE